MRGELQEPVKREGIGRNFPEMFPKRPQPEDLAACGDPNCAGCYDVMNLGDGIEVPVPVRVHPPRSDY